MTKVELAARRHTRNRQGTGNNLRADILAAASRILESTGSDDAVTLRGIAREAGISAPAIYAHFPDRNAVRFAVIDSTFAELAVALNSAIKGDEDPVERLMLVCRAYLRFAAERPHHYRILFERHRVATNADVSPAASDVRSMVGADAFGVLLHATADCIHTQASGAIDAAAAATRVWIGLHGQASLQASLPWFPWPDTTQLADDIMRRQADLL